VKVRSHKNFETGFQALYGEKYKVYGPYIRSEDGRKIVCIYDVTNFQVVVRYFHHGFVASAIR